MAVAVWGSRRAAAAEWTRSGERDPRRAHSGQRRSGREGGDAAAPPAIFQDYLGMTRQAIGEGAGFVIWPESSTPFRFEDDLLARRADPRAGAAGQGADPGRQRSDRARRQRRADHVLQRGVPGAAGRHDRRRLPQDAPGAVRRVRAAQAAAVLRRRRWCEAVSDFSAGRRRRAAAGRRAPGQHGDLLRGRLSGSGPRASSPAAASC